MIWKTYSIFIMKCPRDIQEYKRMIYISTKYWYEYVRLLLHSYWNKITTSTYVYIYLNNLPKMLTATYNPIYMDVCNPSSYIMWML